MIAKDSNAISQYVDLCGTIIPNDVNIIAGPNNRRFILRPVDHANKNHSKPAPSKRPAESSSDVVEVIPPEKRNRIEKLPNGKATTTKALTKPGKQSDGASGKSKKVSVTSKTGKWVMSANIEYLLDPSVSLFKVGTKIEVFSTVFVLLFDNFEEIN